MPIEKIKVRVFAVLLLCFLSFSLCAQDKTPEQREKEMYEAIQTQVDNYAESLSLEDWQVFYIDSILVHNTNAISAEFKRLNESKVSNPDLYYDVQDKWMEETYNAFRKVLNDEQWAKYLKTGAAREKKARDKRALKKK